MRSAHMYYTGAGDEPDVLRGTTMFMLSRDAFSELKSKGSTRHRFVSVLDGKIIGDLDGTLERQSTGTLPIVVNDGVVDLPVIRGEGKLRGAAMGKPVETRVTAAIVDDGRFPLVLDYALPDVGLVHLGGELPGNDARPHGSVNFREDRSPARAEGERDDSTTDSRRHGLRVVSAGAHPGGRATTAAGRAAAGGGRSRSRSRDRVCVRHRRVDAAKTARRRRRVVPIVGPPSCGPCSVQLSWPP